MTLQISRPMDKSKPAWPDRALVLVGHGSTRNPGSALPTLSYVDIIRKKSLFADVQAAFVKQAPYLRDVISRITAPEVSVVPNMTCRGYISRELIPRELEQALRVPERIALCEPVGTDPRIAQSLAEKIIGLISDGSLEAENTTVLLVGHGSERSRESHAETLTLAERLAKEGVTTPIQTAFLEESPRLGNWKVLTDAKQIIVAPFLIAAGFHGAEDIPALLGLDPKSPELSGPSSIFEAAGPFIVEDRKMWLLPAVGGDSVMLDIIIDRAAENFPAQ
ncbi:MAG: hypothetical protein OEY85_06610 [Rhodospirillales bacterium]|nr:hypothetical protein [Rhodospirillales bacterium]